MTLPAVHPFSEEAKPRFSYDSASNGDDSALLHPPAARDIALRRPRNRYLPLLTHILTSLLTLLMTLLFTSWTNQHYSDGQCYDKFNAPCKLGLSSPGA